MADDRVRVAYRIAGSLDECNSRAQAICVEQTIEFPADLVRKPEITDEVIGKVEKIEDLGGCCRVEIAFSPVVAGRELTQLLNMIFGNISLLPGVRVEEVELPRAILDCYRGPRFGCSGLRKLTGVARRPLLCSALKPMGLSAVELAELAGRFAAGGLDLLKDDHGLADQSFSPFDERVRRCAEAVREANARTGSRTLYLPNVTGPHGEIVARALRAKAWGVGGLLVAPGLVGLDAMRELADLDELGLPVLAHPALQGSLVVSPTQGVAHGVLFGLFNRLGGADGVIFPNYGGRFSFSRGECRAIASACRAPLGELRPALPIPAGGMTLVRVPEIVEFYGSDVVLLIGGDLHRGLDGLADNCRRFRESVEGGVTSG
jgi:ribulose-bisphosphate carboxylase large chain